MDLLTRKMEATGKVGGKSCFRGTLGERLPELAEEGLRKKEIEREN